MKLLTVLGVGGMGTVWLAFDPGVETYVAVKMILPHLLENRDAVARFHREIRILGRLQATRSVRLRASGTADGLPFAVMDWIPGRSLSRRAGTGKLLPIPDVVTIVDQLLAALEEIHAEGVTHRDVKPPNIMLSGRDDLSVTLVDFGVAASREEGALEAECASAAGTLSHMSPEQLLAESHGDAREDLWAAAVVAYECLFGRLPFEGPSYALVHVSVPSGLLIAPSLLRADLPASLDDWFLRAFARELGDRFADAGEMRAAWRRATSELPDAESRLAAGFQESPTISTIDPTVPGPRCPPRSRARPKVGVALACALLLSLAAGLFLLPTVAELAGANESAQESDPLNASETDPARRTAASPPAY